MVLAAAGGGEIRSLGERVELGAGEQGGMRFSSVCILPEWERLGVQGRG